jgi:hypothetical protein
MNRIQNHKEGAIADVYDQYKYAEEKKRADLSLHSPGQVQRDRQAAQ